MFAMDLDERFLTLSETAEFENYIARQYQRADQHTSAELTPEKASQ